MEDSRYLDLIAQYLAGEISVKDREDLMAWAKEHQDHQAQLAELESLWQASLAKEQVFNANVDDAWSKIEKRIQPSVKKLKLSKNNGRSSIWGPLLRIAAVLIVAMGLGYWWFAKPFENQTGLVVFQTGNEERLELKLPDQSQVWLNQNSSLTYDKSFSKRKVVLDGEAYFMVERLEENPFIIRSGEAQTQVLGTSFNVRAYPREDVIEVTVETGKVALSSNDGKLDPAILQAGELGALNKVKEEIIKKPVESPNASSWKTKRLIFEEVNIGEVEKSLERHFGVEIKIVNPAILQCPFFGNFENDDLELNKILDAIAFALDLKIEKNDKTYTFSGEGCQ